MSTSDQRHLRLRSLLPQRRTDAAVRIAATPEPYVTIDVGGPLDGVVTLTATRSRRVVVEATWSARRGRSRMSLTRSSEREALALADLLTNQLIDGREPARELLGLPSHRSR